MHELAPLIRDLAVMMITAGITTLIFQKIRQPVVLGYLVAGIIIGPYTPPGLLVSDLTNIKILSELGVIFLLFSLGLEFSFHKLARVGFSASITGVIEVILMILIGFVAGKLIGWSSYTSLFLGAAIAISSSTIIVKALEELGLMKRRFAELIFGISIVDDLLAILLLVFLTTLVTTQNALFAGVMSATGKLILVIASWFIVGYFLIPTIFRRIMHYANEETITVVSIGLCLLLVNIAAYFDYSTALGAFIMGSILAETPLIDRIRSLIKPIRDVFAAIFFMSVGMLINPHTIIQHWEAVLLITLITIIGKLIGNSLGALLTGQNLSTSLRIGFGMAQVGEFSFIIVGLGLVLKVIDDALYSIIVAVCGVTAFTTPYLIRLSDQVVRKIDTHLPDSIKNFLIAYSTYTNNVLLKLKNYSNYNALFRLFINGIIITIIFLLVDKFIYAKLLCWFVALLLSSPFLWGILFAYKTRPLSPTNWLGKIYCWLEQHFVGNIGKNDLHHK